MSYVKNMFLHKLTRLESNKKMLIKELTELASENIVYAEDVVAAIESHIIKIAPESKLPVLYLIDAIIKNVGEPYLKLFNESIMEIFIHVFEMVNTVELRHKLYRLRRTWKDHFPEFKLCALDVALNGIDSTWSLAPSVENKMKTLEHLYQHKRELECKLVIVSHFMAQLKEDVSEPAFKEVKLEPLCDY